MTETQPTKAKPNVVSALNAENPSVPQQFSATEFIIAKSETNGPKGPEPTRYGDWERKGRCIDF
jgi:hypothetical protein